MRQRSARAFLTLVMLWACGARTGVEDGAGDAAVEASDRPGDAGCGGKCAAGQLCIHQYSTHDPPPPLPDGGVCTFGIERFRRCWTITDRCGAVPPECNLDQACPCPPFAPESYYGCECEADGSYNCYTVGI